MVMANGEILSDSEGGRNMGIFDSLADFAKTQMDSQERDGLPYEFTSVTEKALALQQAGRLNPDRLAKLARFDTDLLRLMSTCATTKLPGKYAESEAMQQTAKEAYVIAIEAEL